MNEFEPSPLVPSGRLRGQLSIALGLLLPLAIALALVPVRSHLANAAAALLLTGAVVAVATTGDRWAGLLASASSCVWFDFFMTRPYERFSIASSRDLETTVALLVVGVAVTEIAVRSRRHYLAALSEGNYLALIHDLSELVATEGSADAVIAMARDELIELLSLQSCRFELASPAMQRPRLRRSGEVEIGLTRFDVTNDGLPDGEIELVAQSRGRELGFFVMDGSLKRPVSIEERVVALVLADQVGAALA